MLPYDFPSASALRGEQGALPVLGRGCRCVPRPVRAHHGSREPSAAGLQQWKPSREDLPF